MGRPAVNAAILALGKTGRTAEALALFESLEHGGGGEKDSGEAGRSGGGGAGSGIGGGGGGGGGPRVARSSAEMVISLTTASFNAALIASVEGARYGTALDLVRRMQHEGVPMNRLSYSAAIAAAHKGGDTSAAVQWLDDMCSVSSTAHAPLALESQPPLALGQQTDARACRSPSPRVAASGAALGRPKGKHSRRRARRKEPGRAAPVPARVGLGRTRGRGGLTARACG